MLLALVATCALLAQDAAQAPAEGVAITGRVAVVDGIPEGETLEVVAFRWPYAGDPSFPLTVPRERLDLEEYARAPVRDDGTFSLPGLTGPLRIDIEGRWVSGQAWLGSWDARSELVVHAVLGGHVTLRYDFEGVATPEEVAALAGREMVFHAAVRDPAVEGLAPRRARIRADGTLELPRLRDRTWFHAEGNSLDPGPFAEFTVGPGLAPFAVREPFTFGPSVGRDTEIVVPVTRIRTLEGRVVDENGNPVRGAVVRLDGLNGRLRTYHSAPSATTRTEGRFAVEAPTYEVLAVSVRRDGYRPLELALDASRAFMEPEHPRLLTLESLPVSRQPKPTPLSLRLRTPDGGVASGVRVTMSVGSSSWVYTSGAEGTFETKPFAYGDVRVRAVARLAAEGSLTAKRGLRFEGAPLDALHPGSTVRLPLKETLWEVDALIAKERRAEAGPIDLVLARPARLRGRIVGFDDLDVARASVRVVGQGRDSLSSVDDDGSFVGVLPRGVHRIDAEIQLRGNGGPGRAVLARATEVVAVEVGGDDVDVELRVLPTGTVAGSVGGVASAGVWLALRSEQGSVVAQVASDADGRYVFEGVPRGQYRVQGDRMLGLEDSAVVVLVTEPFDVRAGETATAPDTETVVGGYVRVQVVDPMGTQVPIRASLLGPDVSAYPSDGFQRAEKSALLGPYPPGRYDLRVEDGHGDASRSPLAIESVEVFGWQTLDVVYDLSERKPRAIRGVVRARGETLANVRVELSNGSTDVTESDGRFEVWTRSPGTFALKFQMGDERRLGGAPLDVVRGVTVGDADVDLEPIDFPVGRIRGYVTKDARAAIPTGARVELRATGQPAEVQTERSWAQTRWVRFFGFDALPDGVWRVVILDADGEVIDAIAPVEVTIGPDGRDHTVELRRALK